jgi:CubicO group peptidase (beta-lactamase class C family)
MNKRRLIRLFLGLVWLLAISGFRLPPLAGQKETGRPQVGDWVAPQIAPTDAIELEAFLDNWVTERMEKTHLYSLGFVMVKDGEIFLAKGYGADPLTGRPFDAATTTVRVASIAKLFTATAIMQLYDQGLIDLQDDVNQYLRAVQLDDNFAQPITFHHLLTHTEGFERWFLGVRPQDPESLISLEEFYATRRAARILPPGTLITYDNYASGLLGYLIEEISGMSFANYMAKHIFVPLGMNSSTFVQPPPPDIRERLMIEYEFDENKGEYVSMPERLSHLAPAGGMHSSLTDMGHFLVAVLGDGTYAGGRILSQEMLQMMYPQRFTSQPRLPGTTYGLLEDFPNGHRVLRRDGDSITLTTFGKTIALVSGSIRVTPDADGTLAMQAMGVGDFAGGFEGTTQWIEVEPNFFERSDGHGYVAFGEDEQGQVTHMYSGQRYLGNYRKLAWYELATFHYLLMGLFILVFLSAFISWGIVPLVRKLRHKPGSTDASPSGMLVMGVFGTLSALFSVLWFPAIYLIGMQSGEPAPAYGVNTLMRIILAIPLITTPLTLGLIYFAWQAWRKNDWSVARRIHYTLITLTALGFIAWTHYWNLLGFRF